MELKSLLMQENHEGLLRMRAPARQGTNGESPIILLDESVACQAQQNSNMNVKTLCLDVFGKSVYSYISFKDCPATLADVVPMARLLSTRISQAAQRKTAGTGFIVPCRKGCALCCYYLVTISVPEAFRIVKDVMMMPREKREHVMESCIEVAGRFKEQMSRGNVSNKSMNENNLTNRQFKDISTWYFKQRLPCPFLSNNLCMIYEQRPIVCREHLVAGSTLPCQDDGPDHAHRVQMPIRIEIALKLLASDLEQSKQESVVLPCVFDWYLNNVERRNRTWPAEVLVEHFIEATHKARYLKPA